MSIVTTNNGEVKRREVGEVTVVNACATSIHPSDQSVNDTLTSIKAAVADYGYAPRPFVW